MKQEEAPNNEVSIKDQTIADIKEVGSTVCNIFTRVWDTTTGCYERSFNVRDLQDRQQMARLALEIFQSVIAITIENTYIDEEDIDE